jgi:Reductase C-terminal
VLDCDQYDLKLQIAGYAFDVSDIVVRGDPRSGKFAVFHLKGDQLQCVEAINANKASPGTSGSRPQLSRRTFVSYSRK